MSDLIPGSAQTWGAMGIWILAAIALYCAVCETINMLAYRGLRKDLDEYIDHTDNQIDVLHKRLEKLNAPGPRAATRDINIVTGPVIDPTAATTVHEAVKATNQAVEGLEQIAASITPTVELSAPIKPSGSTRWEPHMDKPTPAQHENPTRPDFARLTEVPATDDTATAQPATDPLTPAFIQPEHTEPTPTRGRHRAEP